MNQILFNLSALSPDLNAPKVELIELLGNQFEWQNCVSQMDLVIPLQCKQFFRPESKGEEFFSEYASLMSLAAASKLNLVDFVGLYSSIVTLFNVCVFNTPDSSEFMFARLSHYFLMASSKFQIRDSTKVDFIAHLIANKNDYFWDFDRMEETYVLAQNEESSLVAFKSKIKTSKQIQGQSSIDYCKNESKSYNWLIEGASRKLAVV
jgi:hypothetical protein